MAVMPPITVAAAAPVFKVLAPLPLLVRGGAGRGFPSSSNLAFSSLVTLEVAFRFAPWAARTRMASARFMEEANISAVCPRADSVLLTSAPCSSKTLTPSASPAAAAFISGVVPRELVKFGSAPTFNIASSIVALPLVAARNSGVIAPTRVSTFMFAPAASSILTISVSFFNAAQCIAVIPSLWAAFTSAFAFSKVRTTERSPCIAASATRRSAPAATVDSATQQTPITFLRTIDSSDRQFARAVANLLYVVDAELAEHGEQQIRHGSSRSALQMVIALELPIGATSQKYRQSSVLMDMRIAHRTAIKDHAMIEQVAIAIRRIF